MKLDAMAIEQLLQGFRPRVRPPLPTAGHGSGARSSCPAPVGIERGQEWLHLCPKMCVQCRVPVTGTPSASVGYSTPRVSTVLVPQTTSGPKIFGISCCDPSLPWCGALPDGGSLVGFGALRSAGSIGSGARAGRSGYASNEGWSPSRLTCQTRSRNRMPTSSCSTQSSVATHPSCPRPLRSPRANGSALASDTAPTRLQGCARKGPPRSRLACAGVPW